MVAANERVYLETPLYTESRWRNNDVAYYMLHASSLCHDCITADAYMHSGACASIARVRVV